MIRKKGSINCQKEGIPNWNDDRITINAMLRAQDQERIAVLEGLLQEVVAHWSDITGNAITYQALPVRIAAALKGE